MIFQRMIGDRKRGATLIELVVYLAIFTVTVVYVVFSVTQLARVYGKARSERKVLAAAESALERIVKETRLANSHIAVPPTIAILFSQTSHTNPAAATKWIMYTSPTLAYYDGSAWYPLVPKDVRVTAFTVSALPEPSSGTPKSLRFTMTLEAGQGPYYTSRTYAAMATLRESY